MKAFTLGAFDAPPAPTEDAPTPVAGDGELLVRVHASAANPVDNAIAAGMLKGVGSIAVQLAAAAGRDGHRPRAQARYALADAGKALHALATTHTQGKLGIDVA